MADLPHLQAFRVRALVGEQAALGGAVTVELCGHWAHEGDCRWPHHTTVTAEGDEHLVTVAFDAPQAEVEVVRTRICEGLGRGHLTGPDGTRSSWLLVDPGTT